MMHLYIEDSAELQIYRPVLNKVHMHLYLYSISPMAIYQPSIGMEKVWGGEGIHFSEHPKFDLTGVRTHDLQLMTVHLMSLRRLL